MASAMVSAASGGLFTGDQVSGKAGRLKKSGLFIFDESSQGTCQKDHVTSDKLDCAVSAQHDEAFHME